MSVTTKSRDQAAGTCAPATAPAITDACQTAYSVMPMPSSR